MGSATRFRFRSLEVDFKTGELKRGNRRLRLREKPLGVLAMLLERSGQLVTRSELRGRLWPDDVFVDFENNINSAVSRLRFALGDSARRPQYIETFPRRGYRFLVNPSELVPVPGTAPSERVKLVVLPFQNLGRDPQDRYISDSTTEAITVRLGACKGFAVIARTTAMTYRGVDKAISQIGCELGVDYLVEGSMFRVGSRVRINASIVHFPDDVQIWATSREGRTSEILALQRDLADRIAERLCLISSSHGSCNLD